MLYIWPAFPIVIDAYITDSRRSGVTNIRAALKRHDLVCRINIWGVPNSLLNSAAMKKRFPELNYLTLFSNEDNPSAIPDPFLGGSAPRLRSLEFRNIPFSFPALRKLLLSATDLVTLCLLDIPSSGIISPDLIVTTLSRLTKLRKLSIGFRSPRSRADRERRHPSLLKHFVLPSLTEFSFKGDSEYLEDIVGRINAPALDSVAITFFNQLVFDTPLLRDFFGRTELFQNPHRADVSVSKLGIEIKLFQLKGTGRHCILAVTISSRMEEWQVSSLAEFCSTSLPPLPTLEQLLIYPEPYWGPGSPSGLESAPWLELLHSFVTVTTIFLSGRLLLYVAPALRELTGDRVPEVLPVLQNVYVGRVRSSRPKQDAIAQFVSARRLSGHPVVIRHVENSR
jgi:hypothetical protein